MNGFSATVAVLYLTLLLAPASRGADEKAEPRKPVNPRAEALIAQLVDLAEPDTWVSGYLLFTAFGGDGFAPLDGVEKFDTIFTLSPVFPRGSSSHSKILRDLVVIGPAAVPDLVRHLVDKRKTRVIKSRSGIDAEVKDDEPNAYTLRVGDLCCFALGKIVNREYDAVVYFPSVPAFVTATSHDPEICAQLTKEWGDLTPDKHRASLLEDCEGNGKIDARAGAFLRLAYYYPDALEAPALQFLSAPTPTDDVADLIERGLIYDRSVKIDRAVRDLLGRTSDNKVAHACMKRLVGRGYDKEIEAAYRRLRLVEKPFFADNDPKDILAKAGWSPLHVAVWRGQHERLKELIKEGAQINVAGKDGQTPLHVAVASGNIKAIPVLLAARADLQTKDAQGLTPVAAASRAGETKMVRLLVEAGSPVPDLLVAATAGKEKEVARILQTDAASHRATDSLGRTPLHCATLEGHPAVM